MRWLEAELPGARAAFSTRVGGVSEAPYDALNVAVKTGDEQGGSTTTGARSRRRSGSRPRTCVMGRQVHGAELHWHDRPAGAAGLRRRRPQPDRGRRPRHRPARPGPAGDGGRLPAGRDRGARRGRRWSTAAGAAWPAGSSRPPRSGSAAPRPRGRPRDRALLLRGRRRGAGRVRGHRRGRRSGRRMLDLPAVARALLERAGVSRGRHHRPLHELQPRPLLLPPPRRRARPAARPASPGSRADG